MKIGWIVKPIDSIVRVACTLAHGLIENGHDIVQCNSYQPIYKDIMNTIEKSDIIFIQNGEQIPEQAWIDMKKTGKKIIVWHEDQHGGWEYHLVKYSKYIDWLFMTTANIHYNCNTTYFISPHSDYGYIDGSIKKIDWNTTYEKEYNILFTGSDYPITTDGKRKDVLMYLRTRDDCKLCGHYGVGEVVQNEDYIKTIKKARIGIGVNAFHQFKYYNSDRPMNYMSAGTFFLMQYSRGTEDLFNNEYHLVWFNDIEELKSKIDYYLTNPDERERIANNGKLFMKNMYSAKKVTRMMLDYIEIGESNIFTQWKNLTYYKEK